MFLQKISLRINRFGTAIWKMKWVLFSALVASIIVFFLNPIGRSLDPSWQAVLSYAAYTGIGADNIQFTYGPLGFLLAGSVYFESLSFVVIRFLLTFLISSVAFILASRRLSTLSFILFAAVYCFIGQMGTDFVQVSVLVVLIACEILVRGERRDSFSTVVVFLLISLMAFLSLVKFTNFALAVPLLLIASIATLLRGRRIVAIVIPIFFAIACIFFYLLSGGSLTGFFSWIRASVEVASGFNATMQIDGRNVPLISAILIVLVVACFLLKEFIVVAKSRFKMGMEPFLIVLILLIAVFFSWKHGFVRADTHILSFFNASMLYIILVLEVVFRKSKQVDVSVMVGAGAKYFFVAIAFLICFLNIAAAVPHMVSNYSPNAWWERFSTFVGKVYNKSYVDKINVARIESNAAELRDYVKDEPVDLLGIDQSDLILNSLNYRPRPVFQNYTAYTDYLNQLNKAYLLSDKAPRFLLLKTYTLDFKLLSMEDVGSIEALLSSYEYRKTIDGFAVFERTLNIASNIPQPITDRVMLNDEVHFESSAVVKVQFKIRKTVLGAIAGILFRDEILRLELKDSDGKIRSFALPYGAAASGFLLNPILENDADIIALSRGDSKKVTLKSYKISTDALWAFDSIIDVVYQAVPLRSQLLEANAK